MTDLTDDVYDSLLDAIEAVKKPKQGEFKKGLKRGVDQVQGMVAGLGATVGAGLGIESLEEAGMRGYREQMRQVSDNAAAVGSIEDVGGIGDLGDYAAGVIGELVPNLAPMILGGGVGGVAGKAALKKGMQKRLAQGMSPEDAAKQLAGSISSRAGMIGATGTNAAVLTGSTGAGMSEATGGIDAGKAAVAGTMQGMLDVIVPAKAFNSLKGGLGDSIKNRAKDILGAAGAGALTEGATEVAQSAIEQAAIEMVKEDIDNWSEDDISQFANIFGDWKNSLAAGMIGGGTMSGGGRAIGAVLDHINNPPKTGLSDIGLPSSDAGLTNDSANTNSIEDAQLRKIFDNLPRRRNSVLGIDPDAGLTDDSTGDDFQLFKEMMKSRKQQDYNFAFDPDAGLTDPGNLADDFELYKQMKPKQRKNYNFAFDPDAGLKSQSSSADDLSLFQAMRGPQKNYQPDDDPDVAEFMKAIEGEYIQRDDGKKDDDGGRRWTGDINGDPQTKAEWENELKRLEFGLESRKKEILDRYHNEGKEPDDFDEETLAPYLKAIQEAKNKISQFDVPTEYRNRKDEKLLTYDGYGSVDTSNSTLEHGTENAKSDIERISQKIDVSMAELDAQLKAAASPVAQAMANAQKQKLEANKKQLDEQRDQIQVFEQQAKDQRRWLDGFTGLQQLAQPTDKPAEGETPKMAKIPKDSVIRPGDSMPDEVQERVFDAYERMRKAGLPPDAWDRLTASLPEDVSGNALADEVDRRTAIFDAPKAIAKQNSEVKRLGTGSLKGPSYFNADGSAKSIDEVLGEDFEPPEEFPINEPKSTIDSDGYEKAKQASKGSDVRQANVLLQRWANQYGIDSPVLLHPGNWATPYDDFHDDADAVALADIGAIFVSHKVKGGISSGNPESIEILAHEFGHILHELEFRNAPENVKNSIKKDYKKYVNENKGKSNRDIDNAKSAPASKDRSADDYDLYHSDYLLSFSEWYADMVSNAILGRSIQGSQITKTFFGRLAEKLKHFYEVNKSLFVKSEGIESFLDWLSSRDSEKTGEPSPEEVAEADTTKPVDTRPKWQQREDSLPHKDKSFTELRNKVKELGIEIEGSKTKTKMVAAIEAHEKAQKKTPISEIDASHLFGSRYRQMKVSDLRELAKERGIPHTGTKSKLIERLEADDKSQTNAESTGAQDSENDVGASEGTGDSAVSGNTGRGSTKSGRGGKKDTELKPDGEDSKAESDQKPTDGSSSKPDSGRDAESRPTDYRITPADKLGAGGAKTKARQNIEAIRIVKDLQKRGRKATPEERAKLVKFVGWGDSAIANGIFPTDGSRAGWADLEAEVKELLTKEEYDQAKRSTQYAHYTSEGVINSIYEGLEKLGYKGGMVLEPGMGVGHFKGLMPENLAANSYYTGIEYDGITAAISDALYPESNIKHADFTRFTVPENRYELVIGNPPFRDGAILSDPRYKKHRFNLHEYFFAKSIDSAAEGGLLVFVTSRYLMDRQGAKARDYLSERADLLGAVRLPQTAFKANAGTEVVTDVLFMQKRKAGAEPAGKSWNNLVEIDADGQPAVVNEYFKNNPGQVLGKQALAGSMYSANEYTVLPNDTDIESDFKEALSVLPEGVMEVGRPIDEILEETAAQDFAAESRKDQSIYLNENGDLMQTDGNVGVPLPIRGGEVKQGLFKTQAKLIKHLVPLKETAIAMLDAQLNGKDYNRLQKSLNRKYDAFVKAHGPVNKVAFRYRKNKEGGKDEFEVNPNLPKKLFEDPDAVILYTLDSHDPVSGDVKKGDILSKQVLRRQGQAEIKSPADALAAVLNEQGRVDIPTMAETLNVSESEIIDSLGDLVYQNPVTQEYETRDEYLSGRVREKLAQAKEAAKENKAFNANVEALEQVQPQDIPPSGITARFGANWLPADVLQDFISEVLGGEYKLTYLKATGQWALQMTGPNDGSKQGPFITERADFKMILDGAINQKQIRIVDYDADKKPILNTAQTELARSKVTAVKEAFDKWIFKDTKRAADLSNLYNVQFNDIVPRKFDGTHLTLPGLSQKFSLRDHQKRVIWRIIQDGSTYMAHSVGSGKTLASIASAMEQKRLGLIKKPMFSVPNHMLKQFSKEFLEAYPAAKILVADEESFSKQKRTKFVARSATENWDAVIITHSAFGLIKAPGETENGLIEKELAKYKESLESVDSDDRVTRKRMEKMIENMEQKLSAVQGRDADDGISFEQLGVDMLYVDEAHEFRKLSYTTQQGNVKGVDPNGSQKAWDLYVKTRYLKENNPKRFYVPMSGTPITNTMAELFTVQRFLQEDYLEEKGIDTFDAWSMQYADTKAITEQTPSGGYKIVTRMAKFVNLPELIKSFRDVADVIRPRDLSGSVKVPQVEGGKMEVVAVNPTPRMKEYQKKLADRMDAIAERTGPPKPGDDIMLTVITDGRHASIDDRYIDPSLPDGGDSKLSEMVDSVFNTWKESEGDKYFDADGKLEPRTGSTQMIFADLGVSNTRGFSAYDQIKQSLVDRGVPGEQIAFMRDYKKGAAKLKLFSDLNSGAKRILIGSSKNMGTGVNAQQRLKQLHHLDAPWYPADMEQREGRIIRQGNKNEKVSIKGYATKGTYDSTMFTMLETKQRFIDQMWSDDFSTREAEDLDGDADQYAIAKAISSGDERLIRKIGLENDVTRLERQYAAHSDQQISQSNKKRNALAGIENRKRALVKMEKELKQAVPTDGKNFSATLKGKKYTKRADFGKDLIKEVKKLHQSKEKKNAHDVDLGTLGGFAFSVHISKMDADGARMWLPELHQELTRSDEVFIGSDAKALGVTAKLENQVQNIGSRIEQAEGEIRRMENEVKTADSILGEDFDKLDQLKEARAELESLEKQLLSDPDEVAGYEPRWYIDESMLLSPMRKVRDTKPASTADAKKYQKLADKVQDVKVHVVDTHADLPYEAAPGDVGGLFNGEVYVNAEQIQNQADFNTTLMHEIVGHMGVEAVVGDDWSQVKSDIDALKGHDKLKAEVRRNYPADQFYKEVMARLAEKRANDSAADALIRKLRSLVAKGLRRMGMSGRMPLAELDKVIDSAMAAKPVAVDTPQRRIRLPEGGSERLAGVKKRSTDAYEWARKEGLALLNRRQIADDFAHVLPRMKDFLRAAEDMDAIRNKWQSEAGEIAEKLRKFSKKNPEAMERMADIAHNSSIVGVDADNYTPLDMVSLASAISTLEDRRKQVVLTPEQQKQLAQLEADLVGARKDAKKNARKEDKTGGRGLREEDATRMATLEQMIKDFKDKAKNDVSSSDRARLRMLKELRDNAPLREKEGKRLEKEFNALPDEAKELYREMRDYHSEMFDAQTEAILERNELSQVTVEAKQRNRVSIEKLRADMKLAGVYFPLSRFGKYASSAELADGDYYFKQFDSMYEQRKWEDQVKKEGGEILSWGKMTDVMLQQDRLSPEMRDSITDLIDEISDGNQAIEGLKDDIHQLYLKSLPQLSARKHEIRRQGTKGFDPDILRSFSDSAFHNSSHLGKLAHAWKMQDAVSAMNKEYDIATQKPVKARHQKALRDIQAALKTTKGGTPLEEIIAYFQSVIEYSESEAEIEMFKGMLKQVKSGMDLPALLDHYKRLIANSEKIRPEHSSMARNGIDEISKSMDHSLNPVMSPMANWINSVTFAMLLGVSPAASLLNLTQLAAVTMPALASKYGHKKSIAYLTVATKDFVGDSIKSRKLGFANLSPEEQKFMDEIIGRGVIEKTMMQDLAGMAEDGVNTNSAQARMMKAMGSFFHAAEKTNRSATALATFRLAREAGKDFQAASDEAVKTTWDTHFDYSSGNRARIMRPFMGRTLLQFKQYALSITHLYIKTYKTWKGGYDATEQEQREAKRFLMSMLGVQWAMSGMLGMPLVMMAGNMFAGFANLFLDEEDDIQFESWIRQASSDMMGSKMGMIANKGLIDSLTPFSIADRVSLSSLFVREMSPGTDVGEDSFNHYLTNAAGPFFGGIVKNAFLSLKDLNEGNEMKAAEKLTPKVVRDVIKSARYYMEDGVRNKHGDLVHDMNPQDYFAQLMGFTPSTVTEKYNRNSARYARAKQLGDRRTKLMRLVNLSRQNGNDASMEKAKAMIDDFNEKYPHLEIDGKSLKRSWRGFQRRRETAIDGLPIGNKMQRHAVEQYTY